ncbi:GmrSD restriction endonuclease domain-containing protein [Xanthomonas nasturtii]|uniref:DUF262 domain-containing protein n=1 Tax=Xanthomonas nasturtii TaxID=1843581 RepID=A0ABT0LUB4_9XANT|nr:DUF262 domain-containing protein [Xanthomonas nasturtii]MCL1557080.1 DUF262 domain-containing protein [Xanthomonas nasturtii]
MAELSSQPTPIQSLYGMYSQGKLIVNRRYQRKLVWTLVEKQKLIDSVLNKYPIPAILVAERKDEPGVFEIIDGLQRLHAIVSFIEVTFPVIEGEYFALEHYPTAKARSESGVFAPPAKAPLLSADQVSTILDYTVALSVMRNASDAEVNDVFGRINTYGHRLSDQERRQAGVSDAFSDLVRNLACGVRGDASPSTLLLSEMPSISIDLPMAKHGYDVKAEDVVWVSHGILRSTELRDSMDEQCIADIAACIVGGRPIERSKEALDEIYTNGSAESIRIQNALDVYGVERFSEEFKFCLDEILKVCSEGRDQKLREIIFKDRNTNSFPAIFAILLIAFHEMIVGDKKLVSDYAGLKRTITDVTERLITSRRAGSVDGRRGNIDTIKGLISQFFTPADVEKTIYGNPATTDIDVMIRRSEVELANYELKQGMLQLSSARGVDDGIFDKVINTICAIANAGPGRVGKIFIGVTDKDADAERVAALYEIEPRKVARRYVVGVRREAQVLKISMEEYLGKWRDKIAKSQLSSPLKEDVLAHIDFNEYYGLGVIIINVPAQTQASTVGDSMYWRNVDQTTLATSMKMAADIGAKFAR